MKMSYLLIGLVALVAVVPHAGFAQGFCHWSYSSFAGGKSHICNTNDGNVGIGTASPADKLHIKGLRPFLTLDDEQDEGNISSAIRWIIDGIGKGEFFYDDGAAQWAFYDMIGEIERVVIKRDDGSVGIGTAEPSGKLHVEGDDIILGNASYEAQGRLFFMEHYTGSWGVSLVYNGNTGTWHSVPENCFGIVRHQGDSTGAAALIVDRYSGNVGIGVTSPARTLHVKDVMRLEPQSSAPSGGLGDLYVNTNGHLYFHNGSGWQEVK